MIRVGLTGGIASGKSTVARLISDAGVPVIDADQVAREIVRPGMPALAEIVARYGPHILDSQGALDRTALRALVLSNVDARRELERMTHPRIRSRISEWLGEQALTGTSAAVVEAALLVETGSYREYDFLVVVACHKRLQIDRLQERNQLAEFEAMKWLDAQLPLHEKAELADHVINNNGTMEQLHAQAMSLVERLKEPMAQ